MDQETATDGVVGNEVVVPVLARDTMIDDIAKRRNEEVVLEAQGTFPPDDEESAGDEVLTDTEELEDKLVDLKVDGEIIQKPQSEVEAEGGVVNLQKKLSLETRMFNLAEERKAFEAEKEALRVRRDEIALQQEAAKREQKEPVEDVDESAIAKKLAESVYSGDEEDVLAAVTELIQTVRKPAEQSEPERVDPNAIATDVEQRLTFKASVNEGRKVFDTDYAHIANDPRLKGMANEATARMMKDPKNTLTPKEIIVKAAEEVDGWVRQFQPEPKPPSELEQRRQRKKSIDNIPAAQGKKVASTGHKAKTQAEIFEEMKAGRSR